MATITTETLYPVCGYDLRFRPWDEPRPSFELCPSCSIQFGYDDAAGREDASVREAIYLEWRRKWISAGMPWSSHAQEPPPNWEPRKQLLRTGVLASYSAGQKG